MEDAAGRRTQELRRVWLVWDISRDRPTIHVCNEDGLDWSSDVQGVSEALCRVVVVDTEYSRSQTLEGLPEGARFCKVCAELLDRESHRLSRLSAAANWNPKAKEKTVQINEVSTSTVEVKEPGGDWRPVKGEHRDVHDAHARATNLILGGADEARVTTVVELQAVGRRRRRSQ